ncbi:MAG TPA: VOC family protein [Armatimonadota bacterium]|jgi:glyoxylase I family protein
MFKRIDHVELVPSDVERTIKFYTDILGFTLTERIPVNAPPLLEVVFLRLQDTMVEFLVMSDPIPTVKSPNQIGYHCLALEVDDMDQTIADLQAKGVEITWGPVSLGPAKRAEIHDPDGLPIELRQW